MGAPWTALEPEQAGEAEEVRPEVAEPLGDGLQHGGGLAPPGTGRGGATGRQKGQKALAAGKYCPLFEKIPVSRTAEPYFPLT